MKFEMVDQLRVLTAKDGYKIYCISTNTYTKTVYLGINDSLDNYREVKDEDHYVDESTLFYRLEKLETVMKEQSDIFTEEVNRNE